MKLNEKNENNEKSVADLGPEIWNNPKTLSGRKVYDLFNCGLTSLVGCPSKVKYSLYIDYNQDLTSLVGAPKEVGRHFTMTCCGLTSLEGSPDIIKGDFNIESNKSLTSLNGGPKEVCGDYIASRCGLTSLEGIPGKIGGDLMLAGNPLTSLQGINQLKEMNGSIYLHDCPITSHILGVFFIKRCDGLNHNGGNELGRAITIVNIHIRKGRAGLFQCTHELIEAGLADFAQI
jgi:hypothetical protein